MSDLVTIAVNKVHQEQRLTKQDAMALYEHNDLLLLAQLARMVKERKSGNRVYYNVNQHINLTNVCVARCPLCAFACSERDSQAYVLDKDTVLALVKQAIATIPGLTEIHMVSALHPDKPFAYYLEIIAMIHALAPQLHINAFTAVEILHFAKISCQTPQEVLLALQQAGLGSLPGGGAEILDDAVRTVICPRKANTQQWIEVVMAAHRLGLPTNATMLYGHVETLEQRIQHLITLRTIQDETAGFQAYVSFPFHPEHTALPHLQRVSAWEDLKMIALARLVLDNFDHIKAFWMMVSLEIAQLSLAFGVDDLDGTVAEEKIIHAAGATTKTSITREALHALIRETGYEPIERDSLYQPMEVRR